MNEVERNEARRNLRIEEGLKRNPEFKAAYESGKRRAEQEKKSEDILNSYISNGKSNGKRNIGEMKKTEEQKRMDSILNNYM